MNFLFCDCPYVQYSISGVLASHAGEIRLFLIACALDAFSLLLAQCINQRSSNLSHVPAPTHTQELQPGARAAIKSLSWARAGAIVGSGARAVPGAGVGPRSGPELQLGVGLEESWGQRGAGWCSLPASCGGWHRPHHIPLGGSAPQFGDCWHEEWGGHNHPLISSYC